jgi:hypothetical protein
MAPGQLGTVEQDGAFDKLVELTGDSPEALTRLLHGAHPVGAVWLAMAGIGLATAVAIYLYGRWIRERASVPSASRAAGVGAVDVVSLGARARRCAPRAELAAGR